MSYYRKNMNLILRDYVFRYYPESKTDLFAVFFEKSYDFSKNSSFGMSYNHISNASLGDKNPGANSYTFNLLKKF